MFALLALLPALMTLVTVALLVPVLVARMWAAAQAPMQGEPMPGWALALDAELEAHEWIEAIDELWAEPEDALPPTLPAPAATLRSSAPVAEPCPATLRCPAWQHETALAAPRSATRRRRARRMSRPRAALHASGHPP